MTENYITDDRTQVAINHIQLLISSCMFQAMAAASRFLLGEGGGSCGLQALEHAGIVAVIVGDALAQVTPALYYCASKNHVLEWRGLFVQ